MLPPPASPPNRLTPATQDRIGGSRPVHSNQGGPHPRLADVVARHLAAPHRKPPAAHSLEAFARLQAFCAARPTGAPLILDSGCGTGESSLQLARQHPTAVVIGIDQSAERLARGARKLGGAAPVNLLLLRADVADIWPLMVQVGLHLQQHWLLYPNPWPKSAHLQRRWHGHPAFTALLALGGRLELRSNWAVYVQEMQQALALAHVPSNVAQLPTHACLGNAASPFERKYARSGHPLWQLRAQLP